MDKTIPLPTKLNKHDLNYYGHHNRIFTHAIFQDYDWVYYRLQAEIPIRIGDNPLMLVEFKYTGTIVSQMTVQIKKKAVSFDFDSALFNKHTKRYIKLMASDVGTDKTFDAGDIIIDFYNEVMSSYIKKHTPPERIDKIILPQQ